MSDIKEEVKKGVAPIVVMLAIMIIAAMAAAASIQETLRVSVIGASALVELYLFLYMMDKV